MKKSSQIQPVGATALPERVSVAMAEIAENMQEGLLALAVGAGLQVMAALESFVSQDRLLSKLREKYVEAWSRLSRAISIGLR